MRLGGRDGLERDAAVARLSVTTDVAALAACDLVIEAIVEELGPKQELFAELEASRSATDGDRAWK